MRNWSMLPDAFALSSCVLNAFKRDRTVAILLSMPCFFRWLRMDLSSNWIATCLAHLRLQRPNGEKVKSDSGKGSWTGKSTKSAENVLICVSMVCRCRWTRESDTVNNSPFRFKEEERSMVRTRLLQRRLNTKGVPGDISNVFKFMKSTGGNSIAHDAHVLK